MEEERKALLIRADLKRLTKKSGKVIFYLFNLDIMMKKRKIRRATQSRFHYILKILKNILMWQGRMEQIRY